MTDYFYQSRASRRPPEDDDREPPAPSRDSAYPPEDEAYWAESPAREEEEPLWYEDRVRAAAPPREASPRPEEESYPGDEAALVGPAGEASWYEPEDPPPGEGDPDAWDAPPETLPVPVQTRAYVPGGQAAAARAAAAAGERNIRFDPTKERGAVYYDKAARHSRHVRLLKFGLPALALLSVSGFFLVMALNRGGGDGLPALTLSSINLDTREITMDKPHISGFEGTRQAYEVTAATAVQALGNPKVVNLETIDARFAVADDVRAHLLAKAGVYDADTQKLTLDGGIDITTTNGYTGRLEHADIDIEKGTVFSDSGVDLGGKEGRITADSIEVLDRGKHIFFRGNVKVRYAPPEEEGGGAAAASAAGPAPDALPEITEPASDGAT